MTIKYLYHNEFRRPIQEVFVQRTFIKGKQSYNPRSETSKPPQVILGEHDPIALNEQSCMGSLMGIRAHHGTQSRSDANYYVQTPTRIHMGDGLTITQKDPTQIMTISRLYELWNEKLFETNHVCLSLGT